MVDITERNISIGAITVGVVGLLAVITHTAQFGLFGIILIVAGLAGLAITYGVYAAAYLIMPFIMRFLKVSEDLSEGYRIPPTQDVIVRNVHGLYQATGFAGAQFFEAVFSHR